MTQTNKNLSLVNTWKSNLLKLKEEKAIQEEKRAKELAELYERLVEEAVILIIYKFNQETVSEDVLNTENNGIITLCIPRVFLVSSGPALYCPLMDIPKNPKTGKQCFFESYKFNNEKDVTKYINDVKAKLPNEVKIISSGVCNDFVFGPCTYYDAQVEINLNS